MRGLKLICQEKQNLVIAAYTRRLLSLIPNERWGGRRGEMDSFKYYNWAYPVATKMSMFKIGGYELWRSWKKSQILEKNSISKKFYKIYELFWISECCIPQHTLKFMISEAMSYKLMCLALYILALDISIKHFSKTQITVLPVSAFYLIPFKEQK